MDNEKTEQEINLDESFTDVFIRSAKEGARLAGGYIPKETIKMIVEEIEYHRQVRNERINSYGEE